MGQNDKSPWYAQEGNTEDWHRYYSGYGSSNYHHKISHFPPRIRDNVRWFWFGGAAGTHIAEEYDDRPDYYTSYLRGGHPKAGDPPKIGTAQAPHMAHPHTAHLPRGALPSPRTVCRTGTVCWDESCVRRQEIAICACQYPTLPNFATAYSYQLPRPAPCKTPRSSHKEGEASRQAPIFRSTPAFWTGSNLPVKQADEVPATPQR